MMKNANVHIDTIIILMILLWSICYYKNLIEHDDDKRCEDGLVEFHYDLNFNDERH